LYDMKLKENNIIYKHFNNNDNNNIINLISTQYENTYIPKL